MSLWVFHYIVFAGLKKESRPQFQEREKLDIFFAGIGKKRTKSVFPTDYGCTVKNSETVHKIQNSDSHNSEKSNIRQVPHKYISTILNFVEIKVIGKKRQI